MPKRIAGYVKLQLPAGKATPAPPVGPALAQRGINIMEFVRSFNEKTASLEGTIVPVVVTVFEDRTFTFVTKTPPTAFLIKKAVSLEKGSPIPHKDKVGKIKHSQIEEIARVKMVDLNANNLESAITMVEGTARSMGIEIVD
ncbi:MAG: 50S ribosomal protein L11 [candidate division WS2 bacterium]|nr:50S ribosomal protein L11 [Candidatus Psychracetigena formicireducens]